MRLRGIEDRLAHVEERMATKADIATLQADLATIKAKLDHIPTSWVVWVFIFSTTIPIYGILVTLLWNTIHH